MINYIKCLSCEDGNLVESDVQYFKNEDGLSVKIPIYICTRCGTKYIPCRACDGKGYIVRTLVHNSEDYEDCPCCNGTGYEKIDDLNF